MTRFPSRLAAALALVILGGCAAPAPTVASLTYETVPAGATLYEGKEKLGLAPVTRRYNSDGKSNEITTPDVTAVWPSGAKTSFFTIVKVGDDRVATLQRPEKAPNLQMDLDNAQQVAKLQAEEEARQKAARQADLARASARCQAQMAGQSGAVIDDCK
jgi:hypothetical protein